MLNKIKKLAKDFSQKINDYHNNGEIKTLEDISKTYSMYYKEIFGIKKDIDNIAVIPQYLKLEALRLIKKIIKEDNIDINSIEDVTIENVDENIVYPLMFMFNISKHDIVSEEISE